MKRTFSISPNNVFPHGVCELKVTYRRRNGIRIKVTSAEEVVEFARKQFYSDDVISYCEKFFCLFVDRAGQIFCFKEMSSGGITSTVVDPRLIFQTALLCHATGIILLHNHPSDNLKPSNLDIMLTENLVEIGKFLEINVLDHIIVTTVNFYSFVNEGMI